MFKNIYEFSKFDNIIVPQDSIEKIRKKLNTDENIPFAKIFNECVISFFEENSTHYLYYNQLSDKVIHLESYAFEKGKLSLACSFDIDLNIKAQTTIDMVTNIKRGFLLMKANKDHVKNYINYVTVRYLALVGYFYLIEKDKTILVKEIPHSEIKKNENDEKSLNKKTTMNSHHRNVILIEDVGIVVKTNNANSIHIIKKERIKHVESWGVRGHYRNLKSGKKVFVKAYIKGDSQKYKSKDYYLRNKDEVNL